MKELAVDNVDDRRVDVLWSSWAVLGPSRGRLGAILVRLVVNRLVMLCYVTDFVKFL